MTNQEIKSVFEQFSVSETWSEGFPTGSGHIHKTWLVLTSENEAGYILQKINNAVFPPVARMMDNIRKVTAHIRRKTLPGANMQVIEIIRTKTGENYLSDKRGNFFRMYRQIKPGISYDTIPGEKVAFEAGKAFGQFIADLRDLPAEDIFPVIPGFHSIEMRYENFIRAVLTDKAGRKSEVRQEIDFANSLIDKMRIIAVLEKEGRLPVRITHNDTKLNNVLFDDNDNAICVIDLDTVMPGLSLYDFGDTVRTAANTANEDEADLEKISFSVPVFKAFSEGFLERTIRFLQPAEIEYLALSSQYMTYIMGIRFLTDYLMGDVYYNTEYKSQNLVRCRTQFRLIEHMTESYNECRDIISNIAGKQDGN